MEGTGPEAGDEDAALIARPTADPLDRVDRAGDVGIDDGPGLGEGPIEEGAAKACPASAVRMPAGIPPTASASRSAPSIVARSVPTTSTCTTRGRSSPATALGWSAATRRSWPFLAQSLASSQPTPADAPVTMARGMGGPFG